MNSYEHNGWQAKVAWFIIRKLPYVLVKEPERFLVGFFGIVTGIIMLFPAFHPPSIDSVLRPPQIWIWALCFLLGGAAKIYSLIVLSHTGPQQVKKVLYARLAERTGASLLAVGCAVYAIVVIELNGVGAFMTFIMFLGIALTNTIRLVVSVANEYLIKLEQGA